MASGDGSPPMQINTILTGRTRPIQTERFAGAPMKPAIGTFEDERSDDYPISLYQAEGVVPIDRNPC